MTKQREFRQKPAQTRRQFIQRSVAAATALGLPTACKWIYANYQTYKGRGAAEAVFGGNHARLAAIKRKYDPTNFFRRNSNIKLA